MEKRFRFDFGVVDEDGKGEALFDFVVVVQDEDQARELWDRLLSVLPAGRVGGGCYEAREVEDNGPES